MVLHTGRRAISTVRRTTCGAANARRPSRTSPATTRRSSPARRDARRRSTRPQPTDWTRSPYARAEHVVSENARVAATVEALAAGDLATVGRLFAESHASLRDRFEVSSPELDAMVEIATSVAGVVAARMTGAGFGGCTVNLVRPDAVEALRDAVEPDYPAMTGLTPRSCRSTRRPAPAGSLIDRRIARHIGPPPAVSTLAATHLSRSARRRFVAFRVVRHP